MITATTTGSEGAAPAGASILIDVKGCVKWYGQVIAVNDVTFTIGPGVTGMLGPNGAGKSTLFKLCTGQLKPSKGAIRVAGEEVWDNHHLFKRLGFSPEQDSFYEWMTGREFVMSLLTLNGYSKGEAFKLADSAIDLVGLGDERNRKVKGYSKGMRQRIKLAQAIAHNPEILFLDEPLGGLDPVGRHHFISLIKQWGDEGRTVVVSSHILPEVEAMTESILLINNGRILAEGNVHQIRALIDKHPHRVLIKCSNPRGLASKLIAFEDVLNIRFDTDGSTLSFETNRPDLFYRRLPGLALEAEVEVEEISSPDDNLEAVFKYLIK
ncbi:ABC transporter ATP-binding protein [Acidobacteriota bacterium]